MRNYTIRVLRFTSYVEMQAGQVATECLSIYWLPTGEFPGRAVHAMSVVFL